MSAPGRRCAVCSRPLPPGSRSHRKTDSDACRQALSRMEAAEREAAEVAHRRDALNAVAAEVVDELRARRVALDLAERLAGVIYLPDDDARTT